MNSPIDLNAPASHQGKEALSPDIAARKAGLLLILTTVASIIMVFARVTADADRPTLLESLRAISENRAMYAISAVARIASGIALIAAAWFLLKTWIIRLRLATPVVPHVLGASGAVTVFSGVCALALVQSASADADVIVSGPVETMDFLRSLTGKMGFAIAGLALLIAARYQWKVGGTLRKIPPASVVIGLIMQFVWIDAATIMHPIGGVAFMAWLVIVGAMLATGRTKRHFHSITR